MNGSWQSADPSGQCGRPCGGFPHPPSALAPQRRYAKNIGLNKNTFWHTEALARRAPNTNTSKQCFYVFKHVFKNGNVLKVSKDDERYVSGELVGYTKGVNFNKSEYFIYDNNHVKMYHILNENFIEFCKKNNLPYGAFKKSYREKGEPIYINLGSNKKRLEKKGLLKYTGWYCKKIK